MEEKETFKTLYKSKYISIKEITSPKNFSENFVQDVDEHIKVLKGNALLQIGNKKVKLTKGQSLFLKKGTHHNKIIKTSSQEKTIWLATYFLNNQ